jgi:hypothetical protein
MTQREAANMTTVVNLAAAANCGLLPWYRERWPWILMAGPAAVVVAATATAFIAFRGADALVSPDYYTRGLAINRDLALQRYALQAGISAQLQWSAQSGILSVRPRGGAASDFPALLTLRLMHPVHPELDRRLEERFEARSGRVDRGRRTGQLEEVRLIRCLDHRPQ